MQLFTRVLGLAAAAASFLVQAAPLTAAPLLFNTNSTGTEIVPGRYIITLDPSTDAASVALHRNKVREIHSRNLARRDVNDDEDPGEGVDRTYELGDFKGYAGSFDTATVEELEALPEVIFVEPDVMMYTSALVTQSNAPWGLGSISSRNPLNSNNPTTYIYDSSAGANTYSYIVDTGIRTTHVEFEGRATWGYNAVPGSANTDADFHGTFVAGVVGGKTYGVAKKTNLIAVKVFDIAGGYASQTLDGFLWAANDIVVKGRTGSAVINMSFGGGASTAMDRAVAAAYAQRVMSVSAAGNDNVDANLYSPARAPEGICVGSISSNNARSSFSNWGSVVDIWAAGDAVLSAWGSGDRDTVTASGTSAASPYVAGLISYIRGLEGQMGPDDVRRKVVGYATAGKVTDTKGGANLIAYNNNGQR